MSHSNLPMALSTRQMLLSSCHIIHSIFKSARGFVEIRGIVAVVFALVLCGMCRAESVRFGMQRLGQDYGDERVKVPVDEILVEAEKYFSGAEVANLYPYNFDTEGAIIFGGDKVNSAYPIGGLRLTLSNWFKRKTIVSVSVDAELYNDYYTEHTNLAVYLYVNGSRSETSVYSNSIKDNLRANLSYELNTQCDVLEICMAANINRTEKDSKSIIHSITIEYEGEDIEPIEVDPAAGIDALVPGQAVSLSGCVIEEKSGEYQAHVVKTDPLNTPLIENGVPQTYIIPVRWNGTPQTQSCVDISGTIVEVSGRKYLEIEQAEAAEPTCIHAPAAIYVNGEPLDNRIIAASDVITLVHPLGDNVTIYYTKRKNAAFNPEEATGDPALVTTSAPAHEAAAHRAPTADTPGENGTYIYTGPFRLVHPSAYGDTNENDIALATQVHSSPTLTAGAAVAPSEVTTTDNPITTGLDTILVPDASLAPDIPLAPDTPSTRYYNLLGLPISHSHPGQLLIRHTPGKHSTTKTIIYTR